MPCPDHVFDSLPGTGWLTRAEADLLWDTAIKTEGAILEIGCYYGRSTKLLLSLPMMEALRKRRNRVVHGVDPFSGFDDDVEGQKAYEAVKHLHTLGFSNLNIWAIRIEDWEPRPCGFCYLDGDHTYQGTINQIEKALECNPQAIAIHDVNDTGDGAAIKKAALQLLGPWAKRIERLAIWR